MYSCVLVFLCIPCVFKIIYTHGDAGATEHRGTRLQIALQVVPRRTNQVIRTQRGGGLRRVCSLCTRCVQWGALGVLVCCDAYNSWGCVDTTPTVMNDINDIQCSLVTDCGNLPPISAAFNLRPVACHFYT